MIVPFHCIQSVYKTFPWGKVARRVVLCAADQNKLIASGNHTTTKPDEGGTPKVCPASPSGGAGRKLVCWTFLMSNGPHQSKIGSGNRFLPASPRGSLGVLPHHQKQGSYFINSNISSFCFSTSSIISMYCSGNLGLWKRFRLPSGKLTLFIPPPPRDRMVWTSSIM